MACVPVCVSLLFVSVRVFRSEARLTWIPSVVGPLGSYGRLRAWTRCRFCQGLCFGTPMYGTFDLSLARSRRSRRPSCFAQPPPGRGPGSCQTHFGPSFRVFTLFGRCPLEDLRLTAALSGSFFPSTGRLFEHFWLRSAAVSMHFACELRFGFRILVF